MLVKSATPQAQAPISGQFGGDGQVLLMTYVQFKNSLTAMLNGAFPIQSSGEQSLVISRDSQKQEQPENNITVQGLRVFFNVPFMNDDTPPVEIRAEYIAAGAMTTTTSLVNAGQVYADWQVGFGSPNSNLASAAQFMSKYWGWPIEYATAFLSSHGVVEQN